MVAMGTRLSITGFAAALFTIMLLASDACRNILWLMTAAICVSAHYQGYWTYNFVFAGQVAVIFVSAFSIYWNIGGIILRFVYD